MTTTHVYCTTSAGDLRRAPLDGGSPPKTLTGGLANPGHTACVGDKDGIVPFDMGEAVGKAIPGARFVRVNGGGHNDLLGGGVGTPNAREVLDAICTHLAAR